MAVHGAGVYIENGTVTMSGGTIAYNAAVNKTNTGYVVEVCMPPLSIEQFTEGQFIGFEVSIDFYTVDVSIDSNEDIHQYRDEYLYVFRAGNYWSNPADLKKLELIK